MTDILIDDDVIETTKPTTSGSNSSITSARRPMFIETEVRTDTITKRRAGSTTASNRSVYDVLQNTKSPTDGLPPTTYTYAHSVSYMPVTQNGSYDVPVMARRDLHGEYRAYSSSFNSSHSAFSSPQKFLTNVRTQLVNSYSAIRDRITHHNTQQSAPPILNSPQSHGGSRYTRTSSQSSSSNGAQGAGYNLRGGRRRGDAPVHSTPRDNDSEDQEHHGKHGKHKKSRDDEEDVDDEKDHKHEKDEHEHDEHDNILVRIIKRILHFPLDVLSFVWHKFFGLPWWLLIPLLLFLGLYAFPHLACRPLEHYPESKLYKNCLTFQSFASNITNNTMGFLREQTYNRGIQGFKGVYHMITDAKNYVYNKFDDVTYNIKKVFRRKVGDVKDRVSDAVENTKDNAKEYCDAGLKKVNGLIEELKREKEKLLGSSGHALKPAQEQELEALIRHLVDEYAADETGQADYALEANGGKIVDTRCTEYTDEPRQNVVKFLGIPIVHMSKQPDIMIKTGRMPGQCFPFKGDQGSVVIRLAVPVKPNEFVVEHLSKSISVVGHINSAPNNFTVYALRDKNDREGIVLGRYFYDAENGPSLQRFKPQLVNVPVVEYIEVRVTSNWGNPNYTCLYRFRVHGDLQTIQPSAPPAA